jgi:hypothetical protein
MKVRTTGAKTGLSARLAITGCGTMALLASITLSACSGSTPSAGPSVSFSPGGTGSPTPSISVSSTDTASVSPSPTPSDSPTPTPTPTETHEASASPSANPFPAAAPATGGGGTAGFQDPLLVGLGGAAILAGAGSMVYRRRVIRNR